MAPFLLLLLYIFKFEELQLYIENLGNSPPIIEYLNILTNHRTLVFFLLSYV